MNRGICKAIAYITLAIVVLQFLTSLSLFDGQFNHILSNSIPAMAAGVAVVALSSIKPRSGGKVWKYIKYSFILLLLGEVSWGIYTLILHTDPSEVLTITEGFYLASYLPIIYSLLWFWRKHEIKLSHGEVTLIFLVVVLVSSVSTYLLFNTKRELLDMVYLLYPLLDLIILGMLPLIFRMFSGLNKITIPYILLNVGYALFFASDFAYNILVWNDVPIATSSLSNWIDFIYVLAYGIISIAACLKSEEDINIRKKVSSVFGIR